MRSLLIFLVCTLLVSAGGVAQSKGDARSDVHAAQKSSADSRVTAARTDDLQALREDITRMKALVQQMQSNLAFVDTTQSPLKHQFQLEIEMWQTLITEMERRLGPRQSAP
jgi:hypothetical protein